MRKSGKYLELMTKCLQDHFAPDGFTVRSNEKFYSERDGSQVGEIDVTVRGDMGTAKLFWAIECRDRPADGPQGLPWIRELLGKMRQLKPDRMIAVSSTGFTSEAESFANDVDIELITMESATRDSVKAQFPKLVLVSSNCSVEILTPITLTTDDDFDVADFQCKPSKKIFRRINSSEKISLNDLAAKHVQMIPNLERNKLSLPISISINDEISVSHERENVIVKKIHFNAILHFDSSEITVPFIQCTRLSDNRTLALTSALEIILRGQAVHAVLVATQTEGKTVWDLRVEFFDDDGKPYQMPPGTMLTLWGKLRT